MKIILLVRTKSFDVSKVCLWPLCLVPPSGASPIRFCFTLALSKSPEKICQVQPARNYVETRKINVVLHVSQNWQQYKYSSVGIS